MQLHRLDECAHQIGDYPLQLVRAGRHWKLAPLGDLGYDWMDENDLLSTQWATRKEALRCLSAILDSAPLVQAPLRMRGVRAGRALSADGLWEIIREPGSGRRRWAIRPVSPQLIEELGAGAWEWRDTRHQALQNARWLSACWGDAKK